jgi:hypothetical protein
MTVANSDLHTLPISRRPPRPFWQTLRAAVFFVAFSAGCVIIVCTEFLFFFTLRVLPVAWAHDEYRQGIRYTKGAFGNLLRTSPYISSSWHVRQARIIARVDADFSYRL